MNKKAQYRKQERENWTQGWREGEVRPSGDLRENIQAFFR
jgi:hypothetical protein